ncbi:MAG: tol-pal system protein YbgF [Burkholderiaceae bacterium]
MRTFKNLAFILLAAGWLISAQAALFEDDGARRAILELRERLESLRTGMEQRIISIREESREETRLGLEKSNEENAQMRRSLLELQNQIEVVRKELQQTRGQNEQLARDLSESQRVQKDVVQLVDDRLRKFEPLKVSIDGKDAEVDPAEKREFDNALAIFRKGDFVMANTLFESFLKRYSQSPYRASALFWQGNSQYANRQFKEAIAIFRSLLAHAQDHARAPEAVLSIANCQIELKDNKAARKTLEDLIKAYPQSEAAPAAKERLTRLK